MLTPPLWPLVPEHRYRTDTNGAFSIDDALTSVATRPSKGDCKRELKATLKRVDQWQRRLYAEDQRALLCVFQAMDAAGKDSTIRAVTKGLNPAGFQVASFKAPSAMELDHDFLWRTSHKLPERGRIGIFNRSYYEEALVIKVHPQYLAHQKLPAEIQNSNTLWDDRYESINYHEKHLVNNGITVLKFWLNVSKEEQGRRFLDRIDKPEKHWKFSINDIKERGHWDEYMQAYQACIRATSTPWAPWYAIPADDKPYMRLVVASIIEQALINLNPDFPRVSEQQREQLLAARAQLV